MTRDFATTRQILADWLDRPRIRQFIIGVIIFNAILLGLETSPEVMGAAGTIILTLDWICLAIFVIEIALKLVAHGARFFRSGWNVFDFLIVGIALMPATHGLSVLRALRILRVLRVISAAPRLRRVVEGFVTALPGMGSVFLLMRRATPAIITGFLLVICQRSRLLTIAISLSQRPAAGRSGLMPAIHPAI